MRNRYPPKCPYLLFFGAFISTTGCDCVMLVSGISGLMLFFTNHPIVSRMNQMGMSIRPVRVSLSVARIPMMKAKNASTIQHATTPPGMG